MDHSTTDPKSQTYSITQLCNEFSVTPRALRFYEQRKLLAPLRCGSARAFTYRDRARLQLILRCKSYGFTLTEIREMLDLYQSEGGNSKQLKAVLPKLQSQLEHLKHERADLDEAIAGLEHSCDQVTELLSR